MAYRLSELGSGYTTALKKVVAFDKMAIDLRHLGNLSGEVV